MTLPDLLARISGVALAAALVACSPDEGESGARGAVTPMDASSDATRDAFVDPEAIDAGAFTVVDEPDTPCAPAVATKLDLYPAQANRSLTKLAAVGARFAALRDDGLVIFDADGANVSTAIVPAATVTSTGTAIVAVGRDVDGLYFTRHDATGKHLDVAKRFEPERSIYSVFSGGGSGALVAWSGPYGVRARAVNADGTPAGPTFRLAGIAETQELEGSIVGDGSSGFAAAWSGRSENRWRMAFARTSLVDRTSGLNLELGETPRRVIQLEKRAGGFALLIEYGTDRAAHLVLLDERGALAGPAKRLVGTQRALGLARRDSELGVLAIRPAIGDGGVMGERVAFRPFDEKGAPLGSWVCLEDPDTSNALVTGSIVATAAGYTAVYRAPSGAIVHARLGVLGK